MKRNFLRILSFIFILLIIYSTCNIILWYIENKNNNEIKEEIHEYINIETVTNDEKKEIEYYHIDFNTLKAKNSDTVGYLKVNNTNINYVVVKSNDNSYYLKHNFNKESNRSGWIFVDYRNKLDGTDKNIIIYGHNTRDGSMFGTLRNVIKKEWYINNDNHIVNLILEDKEVKYQVFSTYSIDAEDYYITTDFKDTNEFNKFINTLIKRSVYNYKIDVSSNDKILTLSTCTGNGTKRMVLHAKELDTFEF